MQNLINGNYTIMNMDDIAQQLNNLTFTDYFYRLMLIARTVFKWNNLPEGIDEKWIEQYLFSEGKCMFYHDKTTGYMVAKCTTEGLNYYDEPTRLRPVGTNLENKESLENNVEAILIRNNDEMLPTSPTIQIYACRLAELSRTIDTNIMAQKTPVIIKCTDKQKQSLTLMLILYSYKPNHIFFPNLCQYIYNFFNISATSAIFLLCIPYCFFRKS